MLNVVFKLGIVNKIFQGRNGMMKPNSVYVKATAKTHNYAYLIKILEAFFGKVKMDNNLPPVAQRSEFDLYLIDSMGSNWQDLVPADLIMLAKLRPVIVFNANPDVTCEKNLLLNNFKGVFYEHDAPENVFKGLVRIINDELWFGRKIISSTFNEILAMVTNSEQSTTLNIDSTHGQLVNLTKREKSVIHLLAQGASNHDIADRLNISDHTVKTHLYSAFKKTSSRNRIELANWAQRYMAVRLPLHN